MVGQIRQLDPVKRQALIALEDGRQVTVAFPAGANIEVREPTTMGTMGGTLDDLQTGYWVDVDLHEQAGAACACSSLVCIS
jgi:hypothetical protein